MARGRAPNGSGTIRKRSDGRWECKYCVGNDPGTGKIIRKSVYGKSESEVAKKLRKATASIDDGTYTEAAKLTVGQWFDVWYKDFTGDLKPSTLSQYDTYIKTHIKPHMGALPLSSLSTHTIQSLYNKLQRQDKPLSPKTIRNLHGILHSCLEKAVGLAYIRVNPSDACTLPRVEAREMKTIADDDVGRFLDAIRGHEYETVFAVDLFSGLRQGELLGLTWGAVDFKKGRIRVYRQLQKERKVGGDFRLVSLKNSKERTITPPPHVMRLLEAIKLQQNKDRLRAGAAWQNSMNLVFTNAAGRYVSPSTVYKSLKRVVDGLGLDGVRFHDLRHSYALLSLQNGDDPKTLQQNMGHHAAGFTLDRYGHSSDQMKRASADRMEALIASLKRNG